MPRGKPRPLARSREQYSLSYEGRNRIAKPAAGYRGPVLSYRQYRKLSGGNRREGESRQVRIWRDLFHPEIKNLTTARKAFRAAKANTYISNHGMEHTQKNVRKVMAMPQFKAELEKIFNGTDSERNSAYGWLYNSTNPTDWGAYIVDE